MIPVPRLPDEGGAEEVGRGRRAAHPRQHEVLAGRRGDAHPAAVDGRHRRERQIEDGQAFRRVDDEHQRRGDQYAERRDEDVACLPARSRPVGEASARDHADEAARRADAADDEADDRRVRAEGADRVGCGPEADRIGDERDRAEAEDGEQERRRAPDQPVGRKVAALQRLRPREDRIAADANGAPLQRVAGERDHRGRAERDGSEPGEVDAECARAAARGLHQRERRDDARQLGEELRPRRGFGRAQYALGHAAQRLAQGEHPQRQQQPRQADGEESRLPADEAEGAAARKRAVPALHDDAADEQRQAAADVEPARIDGERGGALLLREIVRDDREGAGTRRRLADADADARRGELAEVLREAGERRHRRPDRKADRHQAAAIPHVREPPERDAEQRVEHAEGGAVEEAHVGVGDAEVGLDVLREDRDDLAVDEVQHVDEHEHAEHVPGVGPADLPLARLEKRRRIVHPPDPPRFRDAPLAGAFAPWLTQGPAMESMEIAMTTSVLFVCLGNICRSPLAEGAMRRLV